MTQIIENLPEVCFKSLTTLASLHQRTNKTVLKGARGCVLIRLKQIVCSFYGYVLMF